MRTVFEELDPFRDLAYDECLDEEKTEDPELVDESNSGVKYQQELLQISSDDLRDPFCNPNGGDVIVQRAMRQFVLTKPSWKQIQLANTLLPRVSSGVPLPDPTRPIFINAALFRLRRHLLEGSADEFSRLCLLKSALQAQEKVYACRGLHAKVGLGKRGGQISEEPRLRPGRGRQGTCQAQLDGHTSTNNGDDFAVDDEEDGEDVYLTMKHRRRTSTYPSVAGVREQLKTEKGVKRLQRFVNIVHPVC
ncbi:hypothetical protein L198_05058 [Cryptococcus wingfieldii CBS 7118]|uniref:Uncharacterized protein n=1 Tax=Cryptococcus wingfieldii CBS 7118 TaxID=1295528 RepID=A0A1E3J259_9TREE|nr:hypothetical protein L198_05058 [Cryptococcus wingfieldii CBS 7118]ODN94206.1 hypothetical protein L198_05058 [Cryptococcus wingfieldii CBS 7118]